MNILFHTIAVEPARWTPQRVSRSLVELLPHIAATEFRELEIFEPHLTSETISPAIRDAFHQSGLRPVILSSYLNLNPTQTSDAELETRIDELAQRSEYYGFTKLRLFPGGGVHPSDRIAIENFAKRLRHVAGRLPTLEILLETHDGSIADDPHVLVALLQDLALPDVGLIFQATTFQERETILEQFNIEKPFIRHVHLQNRMPDLSFVGMKEGIIPWAEILPHLINQADATLEFVPCGICLPEEFDLAATLEGARKEVEYVRSLLESKT